MVLEPVLCPDCSSDDVVKHVRSEAGKQSYKCRKRECGRTTFIRDYAYRGYLPDIKQQIAEMALNGSGIRDTAREITSGIIPPETLSRVLRISPTTVIEELKKRASPEGDQ